MSLRQRFKTKPEMPATIEGASGVPTKAEIHSWTVAREAARAQRLSTFTPGEARICTLLEAILKRMGGTIPALVRDSEIFDEATRTRQAEHMGRAMLDLGRAFRRRAEPGVESDDFLPPSGGLDPEQFWARDDV